MDPYLRANDTKEREKVKVSGLKYKKICTDKRTEGVEIIKHNMHSNDLIIEIIVSLR